MYLTIQDKSIELIILMMILFLEKLSSTDMTTNITDKVNQNSINPNSFLKTNGYSGITAFKIISHRKIIFMVKPWHMPS